MKYNLTKPCNDCPFRRNAMRGWLGPWRVETLLRVIGHSAFACHQTIRPGGDYDEEAPHLESCAGMAIFLNNKVERSRDPSNAYHQGLLKNSEHATGVFSSSMEFTDYHTNA